MEGHNGTSEAMAVTAVASSSHCYTEPSLIHEESCDTQGARLMGENGVKKSSQ